MNLSTLFKHPSIPLFFSLAFAFFIPFSTPLSSVCAVLLLGYFVVSGDWSSKWLFIKTSKTLWLAIALFAWTLIAGLYAVAPSEYIKQDLFKYKKLLLIVPLFFYVTDKHKFQLIVAYLSGVFVLIGLSLFNDHGFIHLLRTGTYAYAQSFRIYITEGMHIALTFFILLVGFKSLGRYRAFIAPLIGVVFIHSLFMNGRMALISMGLSVVSFVFIFMKKMKFRFLALLLIITCSTLGYQYSPLVQSRIDRTINEASQIFSPDPPSSIRLQYYRLSLKLFEKQPLFGQGPGAFRAATNSISKNDEFSTHLHTHNEYLTLLSQYGLIGLGLFLLIVQSSLRQLWVYGQGTEIQIGTTAMLIFLLNAITDSMLYMEGFFFVFILTICAVNTKSTIAPQIDPHS